MANPTLSQKKINTLTITKDAKKIFQTIYREQNKVEKDDEDIPKIKVSDLISKMSFYYEKIRNTMEYNEDHLLRKNAIERILKRHIIIEGAIKESKTEEIAKHLLTELIRAAYLPNGKIHEAKIHEISQIIAKYIKLKKYLSENVETSSKIKNDLNRRILNWAASDLEERLGLSMTNKTVTDGMYNTLVDIIILPEGSDYQQDKNIQIYLSIYRSYLKFDLDMLSYIVFKYYFPTWDNAKEGDIDDVGDQLIDVAKKIDFQISHPLAGQLNRVISRYTVFFAILVDVVDDNPVSTYEKIKNDPKAFPRLIRRKCERRYRGVRAKLWRAAVRSILYIFVTKSIFAVILEVPLIQWFGEDLNMMTLAVNISFPAILLFVIVFFSKTPSRNNTEKVVEGINEIVFDEKMRKDPYRLRRPAKRSVFMNSVFGMIYAVTFFLSFGFIIWGLGEMGFNFVSITIFLFFLALVSFFSIRIRKSIKELIVVEPKENILTLFGDFFYTPVIAAGKWLSEKFSRINVFVFILDFIIEAPFKIFVELAEEWTKYVRERRDEIV